MYYFNGHFKACGPNRLLHYLYSSYFIQTKYRSIAVRFSPDCIVHRVLLFNSKNEVAAQIGLKYYELASILLYEI